MFVFKFGGASVKNAEGVRNLCRIIKDSTDKLIVVVSALGKTTNALEEILRLSYSNKNECIQKYNILKEYHLNIINDLFTNNKNEISIDIENEFKKLYTTIFNDQNCSFDFKYDQVVSFGEIFSTKIVSLYLNLQGVVNKWIDIRTVIITNNTYREAKVLTKETQVKVNENFQFNKKEIYLTQGFIGGTSEGFATTLGREGSDYTAALLAYFTNAKKVVVWKDVDGILNADPQYFKDYIKLNEISYQEAVELAYFGAKVIHPKTIKPLHNKNIPLFVKSFINPKQEGTIIKSFDKYNQELPIYVLKKNQMLISIFPKDLSFVIEDELSVIFKYLSEHRIKVNLIQNSAISISLCIDNVSTKIEKLIQHLKEDYKVLYNDNLELLTIRHYTLNAINKAVIGRKVYIEQQSRHTAHFVIR